MNRLIVLIVAMVLSTTLSAQHYFGVKGGFGGGSINIKPTPEKETVWGLPTYGISYRYIGGDLYFGGIEINLQYTQRGYRTLDITEIEGGGENIDSYTRRVNTVEIPFMWHPYFHMFNEKATVFFNAGPYLGYNVSSTYEHANNVDGVTSTGTYEWDPHKDNRYEYGLMGGVGLGIDITSYIDVQAEFRYTFSFTDIYKTPNKYPGNPSQSPLTLMNFTFGVNYKFAGVGSLRSKRKEREAIKQMDKQIEQIKAASQAQQNNNTVVEPQQQEQATTTQSETDRNK